MSEGKPKIVIIDDAPANIRVLHACLGTQYDVRCATSGPAGIDLVTREQPDLVLLDVMMPIRSGYDVCARIRERADWRHIKVVMLTAIGEPMYEMMSPLYGANDHLADAHFDKPLDIAALESKIAQLLG